MDKQEGMKTPVGEISWDTYVTGKKLILLDIHTWNEEGKRVQLVLLKGPYEDGQGEREEKEVDVNGVKVPVSVDFTFHVTEKE